MDKIAGVLERNKFFIGIFGVSCVFLDYSIVFPVFFGLLVYDLRSFESFDRYLSVLAMTSYFLVLVPYLSFVYIEGYDIWGLQLKLYISSLGLYHFSEFIVQSYYHKEATKFYSKKYSGFLINYSADFNIAITSSFLEHFIKLIIPYPLFPFLFKIGVVITLIGHFLRIGSEISCGKNFTHVIQEEKLDDHILVINGFYRYFLS